MKKATFKRDHFLRFLVVGSFNTLVDLLLFFVFANLLSIYPVAASVMSTGLTMCMSFFLSHSFVFKSAKKKSQTAWRFVAATLFNVWGVQSLVIFVVVHWFGHLHVFVNHKWTLNLFAKLCGVGVSFILNFIMYSYIFHKPEDQEVPVL